MNQFPSSSSRSATRHLGLKRFVLALLLPILPLGMNAQTAIAITAGSQALLAGYDFDNNLGSSIASSIQRARYSDVFGNSSSNTALTAPGGIYFNGSFGSDNWGTVAKNNSGDINRDILTRSGSGSTFDLGGQTGAEGAANLNNANVGTAAMNEFSINVHTSDGVNSFQNVSLSLWGRDPANLGGATINWFYSIDGGLTKVSTGLSSVFSTNVYANSLIDLSSISAINNLADIYLIGEVVEVATGVQLNLDNIGVYGFAQLVQQRSFWKGGTGTWSRSAASTDWNVDGIGPGTGAWANNTTATFKGTPGTVTVDNTDGAVTITGLKFEVGGYTVAGATPTSALTTTTASTPLQVGDGTGAATAMTATISAKITDSGGINKTDLGTLILSGANDYAGTTTVTAGTLRINGVQTGTGAVTVATGGTLTGSGTIGGAVTVQDGGTLAGASGSTFTVPGLTLGANSIVSVTLGAPSPTELFKVNGALTLDGTLNVSSGAGFANGLYRIFDYTGALTDSGLAIGAVPGALADFTLNTATANQVNLLVNSTSLFWAGGNGNWTATGTGWNNAGGSGVSYSPNFAIFNGTVGTVTVDTSGGAVVFTGAQFVTDGYTIAGGDLTTNTAGTALRVDSAKTATISSALTGTGGINKLDPGTLVLSGTNTYAGGTTVTGGTLRLGPGGSIAGNITNNATFEVARTDAYTQAGIISGTGAVVQSGTGTTTLTGANTYTGGTTVSAGTLSIGSGGTTGSLAGNITNNATVTFNRSDAATYAGIISGTGAVVQQGAGTTSLTGTNTHTGGTTVSAGTLSIGSGGTTGSVTGNLSNNATVAFNRSDAVTYAGIISGTGAVVKQGTGTTTLTGANTYAGTTTVSAGRLQLNGNQSTATGAITVASGGTLSGTGTAGGTVTVANGGTLAGASGSLFTLPGLIINSTSNVDVTLGAPSTTALFQVNGAFTLDGVLNIIGATGYGDGLYRLFNYTGALTNNTMTVGTAPGGAAGYTIQTATPNQVSVLASNTATLTGWTGGSGTWSGLTTGTGWGDTNGRWQPGFALFQGTPGTVTVSSTTTNPVVITGIQFAVDQYTLAAATNSVLTTNTVNTPFRVGDGTADGAAITATINAPIAGTGGVDKTDLGTLVLGGTNTFAGGTRVTSGVLQVAADTALGATAAALRLNGGTLRASANLTSARSVVVSATGSAIDTGANSVTLSGVVSGSGALTKTGSGTLALTGTSNTNTGATTISQGAIMLTASSLGATNVSTGARLAGTGTVRGNLANSGTVSPGASPGTLNIAGNYTQSATGNYLVEIASATSHDKIVATGTATLAGSLTITGLNGFVPTSGQSFKILEAAGGVSGTFTTVVNPFAQNSAMTRFQTFYNPFDVTLAFLQLPYAGLTGSANQKAIGAAVDAALTAGTIPNLVASLNAIPTEAAVRTALVQLSPQRYERWYEQAVYSTGALVRMAESHLGEKRADPAGGLWMELVRRQSKFTEVNESTAAEGTANGIVVGGDIALGDNFKWGLLFGYTDEGLELDNAGSSTSIERFTAASYVRYEATRAFIEAVIGASYTRMDSHRTVGIAGGGLAEGTSDGRDTFASLRTGFLMPIGMVRMTPYLALQYTGFQANELVETGAGDASLVIKEQKADSLASRVGLLTAVPIKGKSITFTPRLDVAWRFEFRDEVRNLTAELGDTEFMVETRQPDSSGFIAGLGLDATFGSGATAYARLSTERTTAADKAFEARAGIDFRF